MKKYLTFLLAFCLMLALIPTVSASDAVSGTCGDDAYWSFDSTTGTLTVTGTGAMWDYREEEGYPFDYHGKQEWYDLRSDIRKVVIGEGITSVGASAFGYLDNLTAVEFPDSLLEIDLFAFIGCPKLTDVALPRNLQILGQQCFCWCGSIQEIEIPASVTFLDNAFSECSSLRQVVIRSDPELSHFIVGGSPFRDCRSLTEIQVDEGHIMLVDFDGVLYVRNGDSYQLQQYPAGRPDKVYEIVEGTYRIEQSAMSVTRHLETLIVPAGVESVGYDAFSSFNPNCVYGPEGIKNICFRGSAPVDISDDFTASSHGKSVTCYYPYDEPSWTKVVAGFNNPNITWAPYDAEILFTDVAVGGFYHEPVRWAVSNGITTGASEITFNPNGQCLRAQVVTFLWRAAGCPEPTASVSPFVDVKESDFYYKAVLWAVENGITNGADATHFDPMGVCNRAQVVTFLYRTFGSPDVSTAGLSFTDVPAGTWYAAPIAWAVEKGITNGLSATEFGPNASCNRAQIVTFLYRAYC